jgi:hypothetical protein
VADYLAPARCGTGAEAERESRADPLFYLREPVAHPLVVSEVAVQVVVDDEALAPMEVGVNSSK